MEPAHDPFARSIQRQIALNQARSPTERFLALCDLLDAARAMAPQDQQAQERRRRALAERQRDREHWRAQLRQFIAAQRAKAQTSV